METMERPRKTRRECQALVAVVRCGPDRGLAGLRLIDEAGGAAEHFIPFAIHEVPSQRGHDYTYAGLIAALERLRTLDVRRVVLQTDDESVVAAMQRQVEPHRDLTLPYIILGCKLNEFASARIVAVTSQRASTLHAKTAALALTVYQSVA